MIVRSLNEVGISVYRGALEEIRNGTRSTLPVEMLTDAGITAEVPGATEIEGKEFTTKLECARYLDAALLGVDKAVVDLDAGMWAWLAVFYFDQLVKRDASGRIDLRDNALYVPQMRSRREYRHLIRGPFKVFQIHGDGARLLLQKPLNVWSDLEEQLVGVQELLRMPGAMAAADRLYFDETTQQAKRGATNRRRDGNIRRFGAVVQQFDLTYDLYSMTGDDLVALLPREFNSFRR